MNQGLFYPVFSEGVIFCDISAFMFACIIRLEMKFRERSLNGKLSGNGIFVIDTLQKKEGAIWKKSVCRKN
jgi:hypothetical protein